MSVRLSDWWWSFFFLLAYPDELVVEEEPKSLPRFGRVCSREDPEGGCPERMEAMAKGEFIPDYEAWGFVDTTVPLRQMTSQAFYYVYCDREDERHPNNSGRPFTFSVCPWCFQDLPSLGSLRKHQGRLAYEQGDGS